MEEDNEKELKWSNKLYMLQENEIWLNEQVQKGLILKKIDDKYATFSKEEVQDVSYKIVILNPKDAKSQIKLIEHQGFTFVADYKEYYIFYIKGSYGHFQPRLNAEPIDFARKWFNKQIIKGFLLAIVPLLPFIIDILMRYNRILQIIIEIPTAWYFAFVPFFIYLFINTVIKYKTIIKCRTCFLEHEQYVKKNSFAFLKIIDKFFWAFFISTIALGVYMIYSNNPDEKLPLNTVYNDMPFVFLQDIEEQGTTENGSKNISNYIDKDSYARIYSSLLAPKQYFANQGSYILSTHYYEVRIKGLVKPLAKELIKTGKYHITKNEFRKIQYEGLDIVYVSKDDHQISVSKDKKVMFIEYYGEQSVEKILSEMVEVL